MNLRHLWLGHNNLSGTVPASLGLLEQLWVANLNGNALTGCLPSSWEERGVSPGYKQPPFELSFCSESSLEVESDFNIKLVYLDEGLTQRQKNKMARAARRWEQVIRGDLADVSYYIDHPFSQWDDLLQARVNVKDKIDDVRVFVRVKPTNHHTAAGQVSAGIGFVLRIRKSNKLPLISAMLLNSDLIDDVEEAGLLEELMLHELGHCLGVGVFWQWMGLLNNPSRQNPAALPYFTGLNARRAFDQAGGLSYKGRKVPVQPGGDDVHWKTSVFGDELMAYGWTKPFDVPISPITVASLRDMGYQVNQAAADPYRLPEPSAAKRLAPAPLFACGVHTPQVESVPDH